MSKGTEPCMKCGKELEIIYYNRQKIGVASAYIAYQKTGKGELTFVGYVCNDCHFKGVREDNLGEGGK